MNVNKNFELFIFLILSPLVHPNDDKWIGSLAKKTQNSFRKLEKSIPNSSNNKRQANIESEIKRLVKALKTVHRQWDKELSEVHGNKKRALAAKKIVEENTRKLENSVTNTKRFLDGRQTIKLGLGVLAQGFGEFFDAIKPIKGKAAKIALNTFHGVTLAIDRVTEVVRSWGNLEEE